MLPHGDVQPLCPHSWEEERTQRKLQQRREERRDTQSWRGRVGNELNNRAALPSVLTASAFPDALFRTAGVRSNASFSTASPTQASPSAPLPLLALLFGEAPPEPCTEHSQLPLASAKFQVAPRLWFSAKVTKAGRSQVANSWSEFTDSHTFFPPLPSLHQVCKAEWSP